jgi:hypothetical protein
MYSIVEPLGTLLIFVEGYAVSAAGEISVNGVAMVMF